MKDLMAMEDREIQSGSVKDDADKIKEFRKKIKDEAYLEHAILRIATDLSHYLTKP